jgi:hypothetical protein
MTQLRLFATRPDRWRDRRRVPSTSRPGEAYTVARDAAGRWGCSCPAWTHDPTRQPCKHLLAAGLGVAALEPNPGSVQETLLEQGT